MRDAERRELRTLAVALLASLLVWNVPFGGIALYPFKLLATWMHELSHGIAMLLTGAGFDHILIYRDTSGLAYARSTAGPIGSAIIAAAGYMGTPVWGGVLLVAVSMSLLVTRFGRGGNLRGRLRAIARTFQRERT